MSLTCENSLSASKSLTVASPSIASSVSLSIENGAEFLETESSEQECPESQGINILKEVLSERGPLPATNLFGYFSKMSKSVRGALGKNPEELLQYLMNSEHFIVRGRNNLVYINTDRANCDCDRKSSCEKQAVMEEVQTRSTSTSKNSTQLSAMKLEDEIESSNQNLNQLHTAGLNSDLTGSRCAGVDFLKKVLSDTEYMPLKTLELIILNCCEPICDSFGENACMLLEFLQHDKQFVVEGDEQIVRMRTPLICSSDDRSLSDNVSAQELQASCSSSNAFETISLNLNRLKLIALTHIISRITFFGPTSVDQLELIPIEDKLLGQSTLSQVLALRNGGDADPFLQGKCLVRDFILHQKDVLCIFDDIVYLFNSPEYAKAFREPIYIANFEDQKSTHRSSGSKEKTFASFFSAEATVQYSMKNTVHNNDFNISDLSTKSFVKEYITHSNDARSLSSNISLQEVQDSSSSNVLSVSTNSSYDNETLIPNINIHHEVQKTELNKNSITRDAFLIEKESLNCVKGIVKRFGPIYVGTLKQLLLGTLWNQKAAPPDVLTYLSKTLNNDSVTKIQMIDFIMNHNDQFDIQDRKVYLVNSKQYAAWIAQNTPAKSPSPWHVDSPSLSSIPSSNTCRPMPINIATTQNHNVQVDCVAVSDDQDKTSDYTDLVPGMENNPVETSALKFLTSLIESVGPVSFFTLNDSRNIASAEIRQLFGETPEKGTLRENRLKRFCERHGDVLKYERNAVSLVDSLCYERECVTDTLLTSECDFDRQNESARRGDIINRSDQITVSETATTELIETVTQTNTEQNVIINQFTTNTCDVNGLSVEMSGLKFLVSLINDYGPLSLANLNIHWPLASLKVWQCFGEVSKISTLKRKQLKEFCERHCDILNYTKKAVSLVDSNSAYVEAVLNDSVHTCERIMNTKPLSVVAEGAKSNVEILIPRIKVQHGEKKRHHNESYSTEDTNSIEQNSMIKPFQVECLKNTEDVDRAVVNEEDSQRKEDTLCSFENTLLEISVLKFLVPLIRAVGPLSFLAIDDVLDVASSGIRQYFRENPETCSLKEENLKQFCEKYCAVLKCENLTVSLFDYTEYKNIIKTNAQDLTASNSLSVNKARSVTNSVSISKIDSACNASGVSRIHFEDTLTIYTDVELKALMCIKRIIEKYGPTYLRSLKAKLLGRNYGQNASPLDVLIHLSGDFEFLSHASLKEFILKHSNHIAVHNGKVYLVNSSQKASQIIQKQHEESITQEMLSTIDVAATSDCNSEMETFPEEVQINSVQSMPHDNIHEDSDIMVFSDIAEACSGNNYTSDATVESLALEFLVCLIRSYGPLTFSTLSDFLHLASTEVQQHFGATRGWPFPNKNNLREFCQRHCDILYATNKLEITFAATNSNESVLPLEQIAKSVQSSKERKTYSLGKQKGPKKKEKKMSITTYDSLRMSPVIDEWYEYRLASMNLNSSLSSSSFESSFNLLDSTSDEFDESFIEDSLIISPANETHQQLKSTDDAASDDGLKINIGPIMLDRI